MSPDRLLDALRADAPLRKLALPQIWRALHRAAPELVGSASAREQLAHALLALQAGGALDLPRGKNGWDNALSPPLPRWILLAAPTNSSSGRPDHRQIPWAPELSFLASTERPPDLEAALCIQRFLAGGGRQRPLVPARERSLALFGDEKRLDTLVRGALFGPGRLCLADLRCFALSPPLVWQGCPEGQGRPVLVVENHHTWHSFQRWNTGAYAAVVYGGGNLFTGSIGALAEILDASGGTGIDYFGDIDPRGLQIPATAAARALDLGLPAVQPALPWYQRLFLHGRPSPGTDRAAPPEEGLAWLGAPLAQEARTLLAQGLRLAQEWIGWEMLTPPPS